MHCIFVCHIFYCSAADVNAADADEARSQIPARRVHGVGFGNIFGKGPIQLRPAVDKKPVMEPNHQKPVPEPVKPSMVSNYFKFRFPSVLWNSAPHQWTA